MANKKYHYYVLVLTNSGPVFVTAVHYQNKTAEWNRSEKPLEMSMFSAEDLSLGLMCNFTTAFMIKSHIELDTQPYLYERGHFEWKNNEEIKEE